MYSILFFYMPSSSAIYKLTKKYLFPTHKRILFTDHLRLCDMNLVR